VKWRLQLYAASGHRIRFSGRLLIYIAVWLLAVLAFEVFLQPEGLTETDLTPFQQRIRLPLYTPLMAVLGLAQSVTWPAIPTPFDLCGAAACFGLHAIAALTRSRRSSLIAFTCVQALLLTASVVYYVRLCRLPSGG